MEGKMESSTNKYIILNYYGRYHIHNVICKNGKWKYESNPIDNNYNVIQSGNKNENILTNEEVIQFIIDILRDFLRGKSAQNLCTNCVRKIFVNNSSSSDAIHSYLSLENKNFDNKVKSPKEKYDEILNLINMCFNN